MQTSLMIKAVCAVLTCYAAGSVPFGFLVARVFGRIDLREHGSGNIGATNVARTMGFRWGALVLFLDALKAGLPVLWMVPAIYGSDAAGFAHVQVACGLAAVVGHMYPCWLSFRGGKGVATALGVVVVLAPQATMAAAVVFGLMFAATRIVSAASMTASIVFAATELWLLKPAPFDKDHWSLSVFSLAVPLLIILRHRDNIRRLWRGEEPQIQQTKEGLDGKPSDLPVDADGDGATDRNREM